MKEIEITKDKGETSTVQTGKLCYNAVSINVFVLVHLQNCKWAQSRGLNLSSFTNINVFYRRFVE